MFSIALVCSFETCLKLSTILKLVARKMYKTIAVSQYLFYIMFGDQEGPDTDIFVLLYIWDRWRDGHAHISYQLYKVRNRSTCFCFFLRGFFCFSFFTQKWWGMVTLSSRSQMSGDLVLPRAPAKTLSALFRECDLIQASFNRNYSVPFSHHWYFILNV